MVKLINFTNKKVYTTKPEDTDYKQKLVEDYETNCKRIFNSLATKNSLNSHIKNIGIYYQTYFKTIVLVVPKVGATTSDDSYKSCLFRIDKDSKENTSNITSASIDSNGNLILEV